MRCVLRFPKGIGSRVSGVTSCVARFRVVVLFRMVLACVRSVLLTLAKPSDLLPWPSTAAMVRRMAGWPVWTPLCGPSVSLGRSGAAQASAWAALVRPKRQPGPLWCAPSVSGGRFWRGLVVFPALRLAVVARQGRGFGNVHGACNTWTFVSNVRLW